MSASERTIGTMARWSGIPVLTVLAALLLPAIPAAGQATISLGRPIEVDLVPPGVITADGSSQTLTFVVTDEFGALAVDAKFRGTSVDAGRLTEWTQIGAGVFTVVYTPPENSQIRQVRLRTKVKVDTKSAEKDFTLSLQPPGDGSIAFQANPAQLVLARDPSSALTFTVTGTDGGPLDGLDLQVAATVGTVQDVQGLGGGRYRALYIPPAGKIAPEVAVLSVVDRAHPDLALGFFSIPLVGNISWQVNAGMAGVNVMLDVGRQRFGPVPTDAAGNANVAILVPPGTILATATVVMPDGSEMPPQPIDLRVPPFKRIKAAPTVSYLPGDGQSQLHLYLFIVDGAGQPDSTATVQIAADAGQISDVSSLGDGLYSATFSAPLVTSRTTVTVHAGIPGAPQDVEVLTFDLVPPLPAGLAFASNPPAVASGDSTVSLKGTVSALPGGSTDHVFVSFYGPAGQVTGVASEGGGVYGGAYAGNFDRASGLLGMTDVPALQEPVHTVVAWAAADQVLTNGTTTIVAMAVDRYGIPVRGVQLSATILEGGGEVTGGGPTDGFGKVVFPFTAAPLAGLSLVKIEGGGAEFVCPIWQTPSTVPGFRFAGGGGATQSGVLGRWELLVRRLALGGEVAGTVGLVPVIAPASGDPANPWGTPTEPATTPVEPATTPVEPATTPVEPAPTPVEPATTPVEPATTPVEPATTPVEPATTPVEPATTPVEPATTPVEPATTPTEPGPATRLELVAVPQTLPRDGKSTSSILVRALDDQNQLVVGALVAIQASGGVLSDKIDNGDGSFHATLTAPRGGIDSQIAITASRLDGDLSTVTTVALTAPPTAVTDGTRVVTPPPKDGKEYRTARVMVRYPIGGYTFRMAKAPCEEGPCDTFPNIDIVAADGTGMLPIPESFGAEGEYFFIKYLGAMARFDRYGYRTNYGTTSDSGGDGVFLDGMYHVIVGATGRLPLFEDGDIGPLDIVADLGYHAQDVVVFQRADEAEGDNTWTWQNKWLHGVRFGAGVRFQLVSFAQLHGSYHGTGISAGVSTHEVAVGSTFRIWKGLIVDARYQFLGRNLKVTAGEGKMLQEALITERSHAFVLGAGWSF